MDAQQLGEPQILGTFTRHDNVVSNEVAFVEEYFSNPLLGGRSVSDTESRHGSVDYADPAENPLL